MLFRSAKSIDLKTPSLSARLNALEKLQNCGHPVGIHLDPIIWTPNWYDEYNSLVEKMSEKIKLNKVAYISLGVVRFTPDVYVQFKKNYPNSSIHKGELSRSFDNKIRYNKPLRVKMLNNVKVLLTKKGVPGERIYLCME